MPLETLIREADVVSLHCSLNDSTRGLIDREAFAQMKRGAILINTGRGALVDEAAMVEALASGRLGGAGLDVVAQEPVQRDNPLTKFDNVFLSPHSASLSVESAADLERVAAEQAIQYLAGAAPDHIVNPAVLDRVRLRT